MKKTLLAITCFAIAAFAVACKRSEENSTSQQLEKVKTETKADANGRRQF
jgi:hypothetical protein